MNVTANELRDRRLWLEEEDDRGEGEKDWSYLGAVVKTVFTCVCCYMNSYMHLYYIYTYIYIYDGWICSLLVSEVFQGGYRNCPQGLLRTLDFMEDKVLSRK